MRIPLRSGTDQVIRAAVKRALALLPADAPPDGISRQRLELGRRLSEAATAARGKGGIDMYLPVGPVYDAPVAASFLVSELALGPADPELVASRLAADDDLWTEAVLDSATGLRVERTAAPHPGLGSRNVNYAVPVPGRPGRWLMIAFSTLGAGDPDDELAKLLTDLFDAIMATFRWEWDDR